MNVSIFSREEYVEMNIMLSMIIIFKEFLPFLCVTSIIHPVVEMNSYAVLVLYCFINTYSISLSMLKYILCNPISRV